jgi:para-aminobenzoate synthetase component 1
MNDYGKNKLPFLFIIDFDLKQPLLWRLNEVNSSEILYKINNQKNYQIAENQIINSQKSIEFEKQPFNFELYKQAFDLVKQNLLWGNSYLLNLSAPTLIKTNLSLKGIFLKSQAKYKIWYKDEWVCFSPEKFIQIQNGKIASFPMKGTIDADIMNAEAIILADEKELAEHNTIVDLIRNDLNRVSKKVKVEKFRYIDRIKTNFKTLLQVSSKIVGEVGEEYPANIGTLLMKLLPAGSISGAPKKKTVEIIHQAESVFKIEGQNYQRNYYTGVCGFFDGQNLDAGVMIRFIEKIGGNLYFKSGGGITVFSEAAYEYKEMLDKVYLPIY